MCLGQKLDPQNLNGILFIIPFYQRGYRWTEKEALKLLNDLANFKGSEYCLQPLELQKVSKDKINEIRQKLGNKLQPNISHFYRLVDGQQRLTTISLIVKTLSQNSKLEWDLYYESDNELFTALELDASQSINCIFMKQVVETITTFTYRQSIVDDYFSKDNKKSVVFLVHELGDDSNDPEGHKAFLRLNAGKTPLTSSELIRALYMVKESGLDRKERTEISKEWELIENYLANDVFWCMFRVRGLEKIATRIDRLFAMVLFAACNKELKDITSNPRIIFETLENMAFVEKDKNGYFKADLMVVWYEVMRCFWWMQSCYKDIEIFNYLGWLKIASDMDALDLYKLFLTYPEAEQFKNQLIIKIKNIDLPSIENVTYNNGDNSKLKKLLLLLNVLACNGAQERFRFDLLDSYDVEHIDSQTPNDLSKIEAKYEWLLSVWREADKNKKEKINNAVMQYFQSSSSISVEEDILTLCKTEDFSENFIKDIFQSELTKDVDGFGNLALLNSSINRSYHNDIFPQKRKRIREELQTGKQYIPPCTAKVFMKYYTEDVSNITQWRDDDYVGYQNAMKDLFDKFTKLAIITDKREQASLSLMGEGKANDVENCGQPTENGCVREGKKNDVANCSQQPQAEQVNFTTLMDKYDIIVPEIQRLYVQGRKDEYGKKCLKGFAWNLVKSVVTGCAQPLDMIYGIANNAGVFRPIDGQQRLTTLLLLSWLLGKVNEQPIGKVNEQPKKWAFRYVSRRATEVFVAYLLQETPPDLKLDCNTIQEIRTNKITKAQETKKSVNKNDIGTYLPLIREYIRSKNWFLKIWEDDPGIQGMLEMLDSLYDKLIFSNEYLKDEESSIVPRDLSGWGTNEITFTINYLDMSDSFYDQIFLKMNSRGKELTPWENIKAILDRYVPSRIKEKWRQKINLDWPEKLWKKWQPKPSIEDFDARFMEIVSIALKYAGYSKSTGDAFEIDRWLEQEQDKRKKFFECAQIFFEAIDIDDQSIKDFLQPSWEKDPLIPDLTKGWAVFQKPLVAFFAAKIRRTLDYDWKRVVWNLVEYSVNDENSMLATMRLLATLAQNADSIIQFLAANTSQLGDAKCYEEQLQEECEKAKLIWDSNEGKKNDTWDQTIIKAEKFLHGRIRVALLPYEEVSDEKTKKRFDALSRLSDAWEAKNQNEKSKQMLVALVMMAMPYWPGDDQFLLSTDADSMMNLLHLNENELATYLLDRVMNNDNILNNLDYEAVEEVLADNPLGWDKSEHKNIPYRRDWQENLLWLIHDQNKIDVWNHWVKYYGDYFYLYKNTIKISGATPINDYRFDFIRNKTLNQALEDFYTSVKVEGDGMVMNYSSTHYIEIMSSDGHNRRVFFYHDHVAISYCKDEVWSQQSTVVFDDERFAPNQLEESKDDFFAMIKKALSNPPD